jgi:Co/Zn/Cd efflux system component/copper chaperone CopZ
MWKVVAPRYRVLGIDCAHDAAAVERAVRVVPGAESSHVSAATHILSVPPDLDAALAAEIERAVATVGYRVERLDNALPNASHRRPAYQRALWIVVVLNVGFGIIDGIAGFWAHSQALKADALDFIGDGLITLFAVFALAWSAQWRARAALFQGIFLGLLGIGVLIHTIYRILVQEYPHAEAMGIVAVIALCINVASTVVLLPHRAGDANVRAVWLFSRNDAIGNLAVLAAAVLVALTNSPWPDLLVAFLVATLFIHSSWAIVRDAKTDLRAHTP